MTSIPLTTSGVLPQVARISLAGPGIPSGEPDATAPTEAGNGVRHWESGSRPEVERGGDLYELPTERDGLPRQVLVQPRPWWRGGTQVSATDAAGHPLSASLYRHQVIVTDVGSGVTTILHRDTLDVDVNSRSRGTSQTMPGGSRETSESEIQEHLAASGDVTVRTNHYKRELLITGSGRAQIQVEHVPVEEHYEETVIPVLGPVSTRLVARQKEDAPVVTPLPPARVDESGNLTITQADGHEEVHTLYIPLHAMSREP